MLNVIRKVLPLSVRRKIRALRGLGAKLHEDWSLLERARPTSDVHVVIDAGAHIGWFALCWKEWQPRAQVHAFEPYRPSFRRLRENLASVKDAHAIQAGLGSSCGEAELNVLEDSLVSNSFLQPQQEAWSSIRYVTGAFATERVPVTTLDTYATQQALSAVHLLKIDVQGLELEVLRGGERLLERTDFIYVESAIRPLYHGAARFSEVFEFLTARGFHLIGMQAWHRGNGVLIETDMLYRRNGLEPPVDESIIRTYERVA